MKPNAIPRRCERWKIPTTTLSKFMRSFKRDFAATKIKFAQLVSRSRRGGAGLGQDLGVVYESGALSVTGTKPPKVADAINDYVPSACPGCRAPHVWIDRNEGRRSILDLFEGGLVLVVGRNGAAWPELPLGYRVRNMAHFVCDEFEAVYGIGETGAIDWSDLTDT